MKALFSRIFPPLLALLLIVASTGLAAYLVPRSPPPPIYSVLNSRAATMGAKEFLRLSAININTADQRQLMEIPGIGATISQRIVAYRDANGAFAGIEAVDAVKGIGEKMVRVLGEYAYAE